MESVTLPFALRLAAIIQLLSSSALRGTTFNKTEALCHHLQQAATAEAAPMAGTNAADACPPPTRALLSQALFGNASEICIHHMGTDYRLRITRQGKLILTK